MQYHDMNEKFSIWTFFLYMKTILWMILVKNRFFLWRVLMWILTKSNKSFAMSLLSFVIAIMAFLHSVDFNFLANIFCLRFFSKLIMKQYVGILQRYFQFLDNKYVLHNCNNRMFYIQINLFHRYITYMHICHVVYMLNITQINRNFAKESQNIKRFFDGKNVKFIKYIWKHNVRRST